MAAADWIGLTRLAGVASFFYTVYSNRRERTARERGFAREQENRREEIALLRRQVEMAEQERADRGRASITAIRRQSGGGHTILTDIPGQLGKIGLPRTHEGPAPN